MNDDDELVSESPDATPAEGIAEESEQEPSEEQQELPDETSEEVTEEAVEPTPDASSSLSDCPLAPTALSAQPGNNEVTLSWSPGELPEEDDRFTDPIAFYVSVSGPESKILRTIDTTLAVRGLRNGVEYSFEVFAATPAGRSAPVGPVSATPTTGMEGVVAGLIVEFADGVDPQRGTTDVPGQERVAEVDLVVAEKVAADAVLVELSEPVDLDTAERIAADLAADDQVEWAEPDQFFFTSREDLAQTVSVPTDSQYASSQWNLWDSFGISVGEGSSAMTDAWAGSRGDGVTVAVIDTGITAHPDLDPQLVAGYDFVSSPEQLASSRQANAPPVAFDGDYIDEATYGSLGRDANPTDPGDWRGVAPVRDSSWHGTKIAGLIAAASNADGITGIAPEAKIQPIRALSWRGGLLSDIAASITWASGGTIDGVPANANPSKVINMSFAVEAMCPVALQQAIDGALERGSILVAAAGNASDDAAKYAPGNCNGVITVAATNRDGNRADYSNYGPTIDIAAPGGDSANPVTTTSNSGAQSPDQPATANDSGTSIAAAHVSAAAAILLSRNLSITPSDAYTKLTGSDFTKAFNNEICDAATPDFACGTGILSLAQVASTCTPTSYPGTDGGLNYMWLAFKNAGSTCQWTPPNGVTNVDYLVVAGGGGGGTGNGQSRGADSSTAIGGGGGGAGGLRTATAFPVTAGVALSVTVGTGGAPRVNGSNSEFGTISVLGGGAGGSFDTCEGNAGGSGGGGAGLCRAGNASTVGGVEYGTQGGARLEGYEGGGGGRAQGGGWRNVVNETYGKGGDGVEVEWITVAASELGLPTSAGKYFAGGGGGGNHTVGVVWAGAGEGGMGGGGNGGKSARSYAEIIAPTPGLDFTGGGGGGGDDPYTTEGRGGSGVVVVRYEWAAPPDAPTGVTATAGQAQANVSWTAPSSTGTSAITSYTVTASPAPPAEAACTPSSATDTGCTFTGLDVGTSYTFTVTATNSQGTGPASSPSDSVTPYGAPHTYAVTLPSTSPVAGTSINVTAQLKDSVNTNVPLASRTVTWSTSAVGGSFASATSTTNDSGVATVTYTVSASAGGSGTITATDNGSISGTSPSFTVVATAPEIPTGVTGTAGQSEATVRWSAPANTGGLPITGYSVTQATVSGGPYTAVSAGTCTSASSSSSLSCTVTGLTVGQGYFFKVAAINGSGTGSVSDASSVVVPFGTAAKLMVVTAPVAGASGSNLTTQPVIRITDSGDRTVTTSTASVTVASSGGTLAGGSLTVSAEAGIATFSGLTFSGLVGTNYTLTFSSSGLTSVMRIISPTAFGPATRLSITTPAGDTTYGTNFSPQPVITVLDAGGNTVTNWITQVNAEVTKWPVSIPRYSIAGVSAGVATFGGFGRALDAGTWGITYSSGALTTAYEVVEVAKSTQALLSISSPSTAVYGETITLTAVGGSGTGALSFAVSVASACSLSGTTLTLGNVGSTCEVEATKADSTNYLIATSAVRPITVTQAGQTVAFTSDVPETPERFGSYTPTATAISTVTGLSSGVTPSFSASGNCTIAGGVVTFGLPGTCTVTASAAADTNFAAAPNVTQTIVVGSTNQTIDFTQPSNVSFGSASVAMSASASSGGDVTFSLGAGTTNGACTVSALGVVTILDVGTCSAVASAGAFDQYAAASDVTRAFQVVAALPTAPSLTSASASSEAITVAFTAPGSTGGASISGYQIVATPPSPGVAVTTTACSSSPCSIAGLTNGIAYTVTVAAINSAGTGPASAESTARTPATAAFAVGSLSATPDDTTVTVSWTQPANLGGGTFTRYDLYIRPVGGSYGAPVAVNSIATTSYEFTGIDGDPSNDPLNNGTSYEFKVVTITSANDSEILGNTAEVVQYPSKVPTAPLAPVVLAATTTSVQFSWESPESNGGAALTSYTVTVTGSAGAAPVMCTSAVATNTYCTASGLTMDASYVFSVVASNRMGPSPAASVTYAVPSDVATLSNLVVTGSAGAVTLTPAFATASVSYTASVANGVSSVTVTPTTTSASATVTVDGFAVVSGSASAPIALAVGTTTIRVLVTASIPSSTQTYTVAITRAAASGGGAVAPSSADRARVPVTPPADVVSGARPGAVLLDGQPDSSAAFAANGTNSGWSVVDNAFALSARTESAIGAPMPMTPQGVMQVPQGGLVILAGSQFLPGTDLNVFAIPIDQSVATSSRAPGRITPRSTPNAVYLGSASVTSTGAVSGSLTVPFTMSIGSYVLQVNGVVDDDQVASVNMLLDVVPGSISMRSAMMREAAFYQGTSAKFTASGKAKLRAMVAALPAGAQDVEIAVVGVSVSLDTPRANLRLARDRAENIVQYLKDAGVEGTVTISLTTSFDLQSFMRSKGLPDVDKPMVSGKGKPLTTLSIEYQAPGT